MNVLQHLYNEHVSEHMDLISKEENLSLWRDGTGGSMPKDAKTRVRDIEYSISCLNEKIVGSQDDIGIWREEIKDWETKLKRAKRRYAAELRVQAAELDPPTAANRKK